MKNCSLGSMNDLANSVCEVARWMNRKSLDDFFMMPQMVSFRMFRICLSDIRL